jgi:hypothetical protein
MLLTRLEPILSGTCLLLMVIPILAYLSFEWRGKRQRIRLLTSIAQGEEKVTALLGPGTVQDINLPLSDFLRSRYEDAHSIKNYAIPLFVFHIVYLFGLYWCFVSIGFALSGGQGEIWKEYGSQALAVAAIPAAGFLGSTLVVLWHLSWRTVRYDLQPHAFTHFSFRLIAAPMVAYAVAGMSHLPNARIQLPTFIAFLVGLFPDSAFIWLETQWRKLALQKSQLGNFLPLRGIQGLGSNDELRLSEEGISDAENLAVESVVKLLINTTYSLERIIDWKDQAFLYLYVGNDFEKWRRCHIRGALDALGLAPAYFGKERFVVMRAALAKELHEEEAVIERFIDTIYNDPRVHQLWAFLTRAYPTRLAEPVISAVREVTKKD